MGDQECVGEGVGARLGLMAISCRRHRHGPPIPILIHLRSKGIYYESLNGVTLLAMGGTGFKKVYES